MAGVDASVRGCCGDSAGTLEVTVLGVDANDGGVCRRFMASGMYAGFKGTCPSGSDSVVCGCAGFMQHL